MMSAFRTFVLVGMLALAGGVAFGQGKGDRQDPFQHPFANPVDDPALPRVLIIGDSISIGYTPQVRRLLDGRANVHRPKTNCRWSAFGAEHIGEWVGETEWDVIHFNFGLWDWYGWSQDVKATPESYGKSLERIVATLKESKATLIFGVTTPPCVEAEGKAKIVVSEERAEAFNAAAIAVMKKNGVRINDLAAVIGKDRARYQRGPNDVHYTEEGRGLLAAQVAKAIGEGLREAGGGKAHYDPVLKDMEGWTVSIDPKLLEGEHAEEGEEALEMLANHLQRIKVLVPEPRLKDLQTVGIWIEHDHPEINVEPGPYHPGVKWLTDRGYDPRLAKKVHVTRAASLLDRKQMLKHPAVILHELVHAYHDQFLGYEEPRIKAAYRRAMAAGLYNEVMTHRGEKVRAYAATNQMEYLAEGTEAYFYRNDFYPFVGAELKQHDPALYGLLEEIWGPVE